MGPNKDAGSTGPLSSSACVPNLPSLEALQDETRRLSEVAAAYEQRAALREKNLNPTRPGEDELNRLDSSIKRNSALVKRLRQLSEDSAAQLEEDIRRANQAKYVSEAAAAMVEAPLRAKDVSPALHLSSLMHQRYADFAPGLALALARLAAGGGAGGGEEDRPPPARRRSALRLLAELYLGGVCSEEGPAGGGVQLLGTVRELAAGDWARDRDGAAAGLSLLSSLAKSLAHTLFGVGPKPEASSLGDQVQQALEAAAQGGAPMPEEVRTAAQSLEGERVRVRSAAAAAWHPPREQQQQYCVALRRAFDGGAAAVAAEHALLIEAERNNARVLNNRGELPEDLAQQYERQRKQYEALYRSMAGVAEATGWPLPELEEEGGGGVTRVAGGQVAGTAPQQDGAAEGQLFDDEESRAFYESLPDLHSLVPAVLLGGAGGAGKEAGGGGGAGGEGGPASGVEAGGGGAAGAGNGDGGEVTGRESGADAAAAEAGASVRPAEALPSGEGAAAGGGGGGGGGGGAVGAAGGEEVQGKAKDGEEEEPGGGAASSGGGGGGGGAATSSEMDAVLQALKGCVSRELCDELSVNFCYAASGAKSARRRMVRALTDVPWGAMQLVPHYARIAATLSTVFPDVGEGVVRWIEGEFAFLRAKKDPTARSLETRLRCMRYMGEMAKFRLFPYGSLFSCLKCLLDDFSGHSVDMAAELASTAGRYLYRLPETHTRAANMMEVMLKLKNARNLDSRQSMLVDHAYFAVKQPAGAAGGLGQKQRPPHQEFIRHLVYDRLDNSNVKQALKKLRRVPWEEHGEYVQKRLLRAAVKGRFSAVPLVASLVAGLSRYHSELGVRIADDVLEGIRVGLDHPEGGTYQRRIAEASLLGELYNYRLVDSRSLFDCLYALLAHGHSAGEEGGEEAARLDPPTSFFRVRLVCAVLQACGQYFARGSARRRLDTYLQYLQRYVLCKPQPLPVDIEFDLQDLFQSLRPGMQRHATLEAAAEAVAALEEAAAAKGSAQGGGPSPLGGAPGATDESDSDEDDGRGADGDSGDSGDEDEAGDASGDEDGELEYDDEDDEARGSRLGSEEEEEDGGVRLVRPVREETPRDEEFEAELAAFLQDNQGTVGGIGGVGGGLSAPAQAPAAAAAVASSSGEGQGDPAGGGVVSFRVVMRRGGKEDRSHEVRVPCSAAMAQSIQATAEAEADERALMKKLVLQANQREEDEAWAAQRAGGANAQARQQKSGKRGTTYRLYG